MAEKKANLKVKKFEAEVGKVLKLMIHSLYTNKDICLRELISNAADALDKLRYLSLEDQSLLEGDSELKIQILLDKKNSSITIKDNGIGMNNEDLDNNLGTIANSGTLNFLQSIENSPKADINLIGQFGVGFYSAFMVSEEVIVISRKVGEKDTYIWSSKGDGNYSVGKAEVNKPTRGTEIILKIRPEETEFLDNFKLKHIITTYSDHISFPIELIDVEDNKPQTVNTGSALWVRPKNEITEEQYKEFYHHVAHLPDTPWLRIHNKVEGNLEYNSLLFIPSMKPFNLFDPDRKTSVKLYVKKVFITDDANLIPKYLRFLRGVVDSEDLPLNVSRETLQQNVMINKIRKSIVKKVLAELKLKATNDKDGYKEFWQNFGEVMKEGLCEGALEEKEQLLEVCKFYSTKSGNELIGFDEYIDRMVEGQDNIFFITGDKIEALRNHPRLEGFIKRDIEVLLLTDHVDDFWVNVINQYKNKELQNVSSSEIDLNKIKKLQDAEEDNNADSSQNQSLTDYIKQVLNDKVKEVKISTKLVDSPACLALPSGYMSTRMEKLLIEQKQLKSAAAKLLEINPNHPITKKIAWDVEHKSTNSQTEELVNLIFEQACILEGESIPDPKAFTKRLNDFVKIAIGG